MTSTFKEFVTAWVVVAAWSAVQRWVWMMTLGIVTVAHAGEVDPVIQTPADLAALEQRVLQSAERAMPAVVAILETNKRQQRSLGSGVIISADGLVLSQYHVTHMPDIRDPSRSRETGERVEVILQDGRKCKGELLGADRTYELSLLRIVEPAGPFPFAPLDKKVSLDIGDRILKLGHPHGYQSGRGSVVRLGRVLCAQKDLFATDCALAGGDSGGPFFDLDGRLAGMVLAATIPERIRNVSSSRTDMLNAATTTALIRARLASMLDKVISDPDAKQAFEDFRRADELLPADQWSQGATVLEEYRTAIKKAKASVVAVRDAHGVVALGTIVEADGLAVTKASALPVEPRVELSTGRIVAAEVLGMEPAFDIALLKLADVNLPQIQWSETAKPAVGTFVSTPGLQDTPLAVGIISVSTRNLEGPFPLSVKPPTRQHADIPEVIGSSVQGRGYWVEFVEGAAAEAGIQPGDVLLTIGDHPVRGHQDLAKCVDGRWAGEALTVRLLRTGSTHELTLRLRPQVLQGQSKYSRGEYRFPTVFEHDAPIFGYECGGPVVGLTGGALGITIARVGDYGCMAIPGDRIKALMPDLKSGKLAEHWTKYRQASLARDATIPTPENSTVGEPVAITLDELKQKLQERRERMMSLVVEYELFTETQADPTLLASWNIMTFRDSDYREYHRMGFSGLKRLSEVSVRPQLLVRSAPADRIDPGPNAPAPVVQAVERERLETVRSRQEGRTDHLFLRGRGQQTRYFFDGNECFAWDEFQKKMLPKRPNSFYFPDMYLSGLGLRPINPQPDEQQRRRQQHFWFPDNFASYDQCRIFPNHRIIDGAACIVIEAMHRAEYEGISVEQTDNIWFDPSVGLAPRRWEQRRWDPRLGSVILNVSTNSQFEEFAPGCWLPWETTRTVFTPEWVAAEYRNQPAYRYHMRLRKVRLNDVPDALFRP